MADTPARRRTAVLISGRGSNLRALIEACATPGWPAQIVLAAADRPAATGLAFAEAAGIPVGLVDYRRFATREAFEDALDGLLQEHGVELVCLAGFLRRLTAGFVARWHDRLLNIHPSLLPAYRGLDTHARVLADGVRIHGCTVHLVRPALDDGPIIVQAAVPVEPDDDPASLGARVLAAEHLCYPFALRLVASGAIAVRDGRVFLQNKADRPSKNRLLISPGI